MLRYKFKVQSPKLTIKSYREAVAFLESLSNISSSDRRTPKIAGENLKKVRVFLRFLGNPEKKLKIIHIAGTSGKGSVAAMLQNILSSAGRKAGLYTSPHTTTYCERIRAGHKYIGEKDLVGLTNFLKDKMDDFSVSLNFFEFTFCLAICYFSRQKCDYAVIETGCGGRFDSTNAIQKPIYTIITNIGRDHLDVIGPTLKDIAYEKAGIIKKGTPFLTGESDKRWAEVFKKQAKLLNCYIVKLLDWKNLKNINISLDSTEFEYKGEKYKLKLLGKHQARNAALAIECARELKIPQMAIKRGLAKTFYPARLEVVFKKPLIIIDGAHNTDKLKTGLEFIRTQSAKRKAKKYLILGMAKNKEINRIVPVFAEYFDKIYLTRFSNPFRKCYSFNDWLKIFPAAARKKIIYFHYAKDALLDILPKLRNNDLLLATGSIFLAGELREHWYSEEYILKNRKSD